MVAGLKVRIGPAAVLAAGSIRRGDLADSLDRRGRHRPRAKANILCYTRSTTPFQGAGERRPYLAAPVAPHDILGEFDTAVGDELTEVAGGPAGVPMTIGVDRARREGLNAPPVKAWTKSEAMTPPWRSGFAPWQQDRSWSCLCFAGTLHA